MFSLALNVLIFAPFLPCGKCQCTGGTERPWTSALPTHTPEDMSKEQPSLGWRPRIGSECTKLTAGLGFSR